MSGQPQRWAVYVRWPNGRRETIFTESPAEVARRRSVVMATVVMPRRVVTVMPERAR